MAKGKTTREAILAEALSQAVVLGLEGVTLGVLAGRLNLSKSGLFAHFKSKEALQVAVLEAGLERFRARVVAPAFALPKGRGRVEALFANWLDWLEGVDGLPGCLLTTANQEFTHRGGQDGGPGAGPGASPVRDMLVRAQVEWQGALRWAVTQAIATGEFRDGLDADLFVARMNGTALAFQQALKLLADVDARPRAEAAFTALLAEAARPA